MSLLVACTVASTGAAATTLAPGTAANHIETWAYDDSASAGWCDGGYGASASLVQKWVTYAETNCGPNATKALSDCHSPGITYCTVLAYLDPNRIWPQNPIVRQNAPTQENWWLHQPGYTDAAHRLTLNSQYGTGYLLNQTTPSVQQWLQSYLRSNFDSWNGLMVDDTGASMSAQFWGSGFDSSRELSTDASVVDEHRQLAGLLVHSDRSPFVQVDNGITANPYVRPAFPLLNNRSGVVGLVAEGEPWEYGLQPFFSTLLDEMAFVDGQSGDFIVLLSYDHGGAQAARRLQEATVLLGYSPGHVVDWADLEDDNLDLAIWPEEGIYPTQPLESMGSPAGHGCLAGTGIVCSGGGHNDLQVAPGIFRREFAACYEQGESFGKCAVIVNDTSSSATVSASWLRQAYSHEITMSGGDVQSGGTIHTAGAPFIAGSTSVPGGDAVLLAQ